MPYPGGFYSPLAPSLPATLGTYSQWGRPGFTRTLGCSSQDSSLGQWGSPLELSLGDVAGSGLRLHRKLGFGAFCLGGLQTLALLFRPKTTNKFRKYWKSYHHFVGYACVVLGVVNVFQGFEVMGSSRSYAKLAYCLSLATLIGICIASEVNSWVIFCRKSQGRVYEKRRTNWGIRERKWKNGLS
ncbi:Cytochrome b561 and DOMON domain-containing protein [Vitis vinifera]|uniref:Cytochrome b561 and DOMON domain-containing protein n=1 Tax=Vitis vinifera TaxID=29760 RepID=A0A438DQ63_VITVI|nr:Cytochrome b561 and DOMON domain-containing protein [Vitis vinifera]